MNEWAYSDTKFHMLIMYEKMNSTAMQIKRIVCISSFFLFFLQFFISFSFRDISCRRGSIFNYNHNFLPLYLPNKSWQDNHRRFILTPIAYKFSVVLYVSIKSKLTNTNRRFFPTKDMQTPPQFCSHFHDRCSQCWIKWKINFPIFWVKADCQMKAVIISYFLQI